MENFIVSALKYRPSTFESVVGQHALVTTLKNAIVTNHLAHAYLFCGPRGVGKTTCARIFAKTINCQNLTAEHEACNVCESCVSFNDQRSYNIHELDAASNNSVEDIRLLIEKVRIPPQIGKYSVFIIDEVHMLSQAAFNAFLKTLEEPPAHALFILATTEKHKIIPTILSRCQIYDFNRITINDTVAHLQFVAQKENITAEPEALNVIAQKADGGMRDALSIFDQVVSFCGNTITYKDVIENLNVLDYDYYFRLVDAFIAGEVPQALMIFNEILSKGFDGGHFISGLSAHLRDVMVCKDPATVKLLEVGASIGEAYLKQAAKCDIDFLYQALKIANDCDLNYRQSKNKRLLVEITLIRLCQLSDKKKTDIVGSSDEKVVIEKLFFPKKEENTTQASQQPAQPQPTTPVVEKVPTVEKTVAEQKPAFSPSAPKFAVPTSISINKVVSQTVETNTVEQKDRKESFSQEKLSAAWIKFAKSLPIEQMHLMQTMELNIPSLKSDILFEVMVNNAIQQKSFEEIKPKLIRFLADELHNDFLEMKIRIDETQELNKVELPSRYF